MMGHSFELLLNLLKTVSCTQALRRGLLDPKICSIRLCAKALLRAKKVKDLLVIMMI